jgi:tetratricopeptide (TPR) repeat protein
MYLDWELEESKKHFQYALDINPNCLIAHNRYSSVLAMQGRFSEALKEIHQLMLIDPFSLVNYKRIGRLFYRMGQFENAITYLKEALELEPNDYETLVLLGGVLTELGDYDEALNLFQKSLNIHYNIDTLSMFGYIYALLGKKEMAHQIIKQLESESKSDCPHAIKLARIYVALEEKERAYNYLEQAFNQHDVDLTTLKSDPRWATMHHETRFKELIMRVGLPID